MVARLGRRDAERMRGDLDRLAGDGRALIRHLGGVAEHHHDGVGGNVQLLRDDLSERGADTGSKIDMSVEGIDRAFRGKADKDVECVLGGLRLGISTGHDHGEHTASLQKFSARRRGGLRHGEPPTTRMVAAARITARRISTWVPQRQRLKRSALRTSFSSGSGLRSSSALAVMIMPLRQ
jgi:hypothetical protein